MKKSFFYYFSVVKRGKKFPVFLISAITIFIFLGYASYQSTFGAVNPELAVHSMSADAGSSFNLLIDFNPGTAGISALSFDITLPPEIAYNSITAGEAAVNAQKTVVANAEGQTVTVVVFGFNFSTVINTGPVAVIKLSVPAGTFSQTIPIKISLVSFSDPNAKLVTGTGTSGFITINGLTPTPTPTPIPTSTPTPTPIPTPIPTPVPTPIPTPVPTPVPTPTPTPLPTPIIFPTNQLTCSPSFQNVTLGVPVTFLASGNGPFSWRANGANPSTSSGPVFTTVFYSEGFKVINVTANGQSAGCTVNATAADSTLPKPTPYPISTPVPTPIPTPTPSPVPSFSFGGKQILCGPIFQIVSVGQSVFFSATGGNGNYSWRAPMGNPSAGTGSSFFTSFSSPGFKVVNVSDSSGQSMGCTVSVE